MRSPAFRHCLLRAGAPLFLLLLLALTSVGGFGADKGSSTTPAATEKDLTIKLPASGEYLVWLEAQTASGAGNANEKLSAATHSLVASAGPWEVIASPVVTPRSETMLSVIARP